MKLCSSLSTADFVEDVLDQKHIIGKMDITPEFLACEKRRITDIFGFYNVSAVSFTT